MAIAISSAPAPRWTATNSDLLHDTCAHDEMITTISPPIAFFAILFLALGIEGSWAQSPSPTSPQPPITIERQPGHSYRAGTRVRVPNGTASFLIPAGWRGEQLDNLAAVLLVSEKEAGFVLAFAILNQTEEELVILLGEPQPITDRLVFEPTGTVTRKGNVVTASYVAGTLIGRGLAIVGPESQGILFLHGRPQKESRPSLSPLDELADHISFTPMHNGIVQP